MMYFQILLMTLQFQKALQHLHDIQYLHEDCVHFAVVFDYYGVIDTSHEDLDTHFITQDKKGKSKISVFRLIKQYVKSVVAPFDTERALEVCCLFFFFFFFFFFSFNYSICILFETLKFVFILSKIFCCLVESLRKYLEE